ncbi:G5 domain-containing protein [Actinoplanes sp. NPDC049681]|uniref:G5 domain-containing protein n=1 Tax=Actinoplanes sp. NPDC049681 TaxID=3363905 RepID=UPI00378CECAB
MTKQTRIGLIVAALVLAGGGTAAAVAVVTGNDDGVAGTFQAAQPTDSAASSAPPSTDAAPGDGKRTVSETEPIKFKTRTVKDNWLAKGEKEKRTGGVDGVRTKTYEVTVVDGRETKRKLVKSEVTRKPVDEVIAVGTF